ACLDHGRRHCTGSHSHRPKHMVTAKPDGRYQQPVAALERDPLAPKQMTVTAYVERLPETAAAKLLTRRAAPKTDNLPAGIGCVRIELHHRGSAGISLVEDDRLRRQPFQDRASRGIELRFEAGHGAV